MGFVLGHQHATGKVQYIAMPLNVLVNLGEASFGVCANDNAQRLGRLGPNIRKTRNNLGC